MIGAIKRVLGARILPPDQTLQEFHFRCSLREKGWRGGPVKLDHQKGMCWHPETGWVPLTFPEALISKIRAISPQTRSDYFFQGVVSPGREWVLEYDGAKQSFYGRSRRKKYKIDTEYYATMKGAKFTLAPTGDCPWSYRFFEAIICKTIPILEANDKDVYADGFFTLRHGENHHYDPSLADDNFSKFIKNHTLNGLLK